MRECRKVPLLDGIVERPVPSIEPHLCDSRRANDENSRDSEQAKDVTPLRRPERDQKSAQGANERRKFLSESQQFRSVCGRTVGHHQKLLMEAM